MTNKQKLALEIEQRLSKSKNKPPSAYDIVLRKSLSRKNSKNSSFHSRDSSANNDDS